MNRYLIFAIVCLLFMYSCTDNKITLTNATSQPRTDEVVVLNRAEITELVGEIPQNMVPVASKSENEVLPSQTDDLNLDGIWDEFAFLCSFSPEEKIEIAIDFVDNKSVPAFPARTNIHLGIRKSADEDFIKVTEHIHSEIFNSYEDFQKYQFDGPGWENDKIGFRNYLDNRNNMDIWGKITPELILNNVGLSGDNYHTLSSWGMDILKPGNSLGAGAIAMLDNGKLYRLAEKNPEDKSFKVISNGPIRSILRLTYNNWEVNGKNYKLVQDIAINAGAYNYESTLTLTGDFDTTNLVTGITTINLPSDAKISRKNITNKIRCLATHGIQSENKDNLGMAILVNQDFFNGFDKAPDEAQGDEIIKTELVKLKMKNGVPAKFYFYACWEKSSMPFSYRTNFMGFIQTGAEALETPLIIE